MAEGFARKFAPPQLQIFSAGIAPKGIHPLAIKVMAELDIDLSEQSSKDLSGVPLEKIDQLITLCGDADENCPAFPTTVLREHWPLEDPAKAEGSQEEIMQTFRRIRDEISHRVETLFRSD